MTLRIHRLCSHKKNIDHWLRKFFEYILDQGYYSEITLPLLNDVILSMHTFLATSNAYHLLLKARKEEASRNQVFYKLKFHPGDPHSALIQKVWRNCVLQPPGKPHVSKLRNQFGDHVKIDRRLEDTIPLDFWMSAEYGSPGLHFSL